MKVKNFIGVSDRVATIEVEIHGSSFTIIQVYAPTKKAKENEVQCLYDSIEKIIENKTENIILLGDMNAKIG